MKPLSKRQKSILTFIEDFGGEHHYPPTIREIQDGLDISSTSVVDYNLNVLEQRNLLRRNRNISRGIELVNRSGEFSTNVTRVPIIGQIAAGMPIPVPGDLTEPDFDDSIELGTDMLGNNLQGLFALRVKGHSMVDALINDGDVVVLRQQQTCENGDTVAVWLKQEEETTLKRFYRDGSRIRLQPANVTMDPIFAEPSNVEIQGKLVTVVRPAL